MSESCAASREAEELAGVAAIGRENGTLSAGATASAAVLESRARPCPRFVGEGATQLATRCMAARPWSGHG